MLTTKNNEDFDYFYDDLIYEDSIERRQFFRATHGTEVSCEFLSYVMSLLHEVDIHVLITTDDLIIKHLHEINAPNDDPTKAIDFTNQLIKLNLLPLAYIGKDISDRAIYRINFSAQHEARFQPQSNVVGEIK